MSRTYKIHGHKSPGCQWSEAKLKVKRSSLRSKTRGKIKKAPDADDIVLDNREKVGFCGFPGGMLYLDPLTSEEAFLQNILSMRQAVMNGDLSGGTLSRDYENLIRYACVTKDLTELSVAEIKDCVHRYYACKGGKKNVSAADMAATTEKKGEKKVRKILYIHGFNGAPVGTTYSRVKKFFADDVIVAKKFDLLKYDETMAELKEMIRENGVDMIFSQSLGSFYALALSMELEYDAISKIIVNPCMLPSVEIPKIAKDEIDRQWIEEFQAREAKLYQSVAAASVQSVFGIFGQNDELLSYIDMFNNVYGTKCNGRENSLIVPGGHLLPADSLKEGLTHAMEYLEPLMSNSFQKFKRAVSLYSQDRIDEFADFVIENFEHEEYEKLLEIIDRDELETSDMSSYSKKKRNANNVLNEFALERKVYRNQVENHIPQLVENYFLVLYTKDKNLQTYNHWKSELRSYINTICKYSTKSGNKKKIIRYLLIEGFELNNPERVKSMVESKVLSDDISPYCSRISQSIDSLISCLAGEISTESFMLANNL